MLVGGDTHPAAAQVQLELVRAAPVWRRLQVVDDLNRAGRQAALGGLRRRFPMATEEELRRRLADLVLGPELALKLYGPLVAAYAA